MAFDHRSIWRPLCGAIIFIASMGAESPSSFGIGSDIGDVDERHTFPPSGSDSALPVYLAENQGRLHPMITQDDMESAGGHQGAINQGYRGMDGIDGSEDPDFCCPRHPIHRQKMIACFWLGGFLMFFLVLWKIADQNGLKTGHLFGWLVPIPSRATSYRGARDRQKKSR